MKKNNFKISPSYKNKWLERKKKIDRKFILLIGMLVFIFGILLSSELYLINWLVELEINTIFIIFIILFINSILAMSCILLLEMW